MSFRDYLVADPMGQNILAIMTNTFIVTLMLLFGESITFFQVFQNHILLIILMNIMVMRKGDSR